MAIAASKLDDKGVSFEFLAVEGRHHVLRVIGAFILNEAESVHELDFSDCTMTKLAEKLFNFLFPSVFWKVAQIQASARVFSSHG